MLLDAVPDLALSGRRRKPVSGEIPNPISPPSGCAFHPRCALVTDACKIAVPAPRATATGMAACILVGADAVSVSEQA
jgi:peptide/nickel transport system ATP-binding protein